ncbi:hypothetical protein E4U59_006367 [Claviceps monticola]|nr:hypothetical protein E4U59_006367 [Claviceps monticola]
MEDHMPRHGRKPGEHKRSVLRGEGERFWQACLLQSYSTAPNRINNFVVTVQEANAGPGPSSSSSSSSSEAVAAAVAAAHEHPGQPAADAAFLNEMLQDLDEVDRGLERKAALVGTYDRRSTERWLIHTGFAMYLEGLLDAEISSSFRLPKKGCVGHFTVRAEPDAETVSPTSERQEYAQLPQDIIRPTNGQRSAMQHIQDKLSELKTIDAWSHRSAGGGSAGGGG